MKQKDIDRLKEICEKEGFELEIPGEAYFSGKQAFTITKKDRWEGIEFVEYLGPAWTDYNRSVFKVISIDDKINVIDETKEGGLFLKKNCKPSTEQSYFKQLKKEAFERFGDIKEGDRFERSWEPKMDQRRKFTIGDRDYTTCGFSYDKELDSFKFDGHSIYKSGKWATKLPEKAKVIPDLYYDHLSHSEEHHVFAFKIKNLSDGYSVAEVSNFLAKQLENYLNDNKELDYGKCGSCRLFKDDISCTNSKCSNFPFK